jgi:flagellin-like protein
MKKINTKKGVSPVVSTVLLIALVLILAVIILLWSKSFIKERILKFDKAIETVCSEVNIETFNEDGQFGFSNTGNVPVYAVDLKTSLGGSSNIQRLEDLKIGPGMSTQLGENYGDYEEIKIIPILIGKTKSGATKEYACPESNSFVI